MPPALKVQLLGNCSLSYDGEPLTSMNTPRLQSLLAYLVLHSDAPQLRQHLAFLFWPDSSESQARNNLRQTLHALRLALPNTDTYLYADTNTLQWRPDAPCLLDVAEFGRALAQAEAAEHQVNLAAQRTALERAANLYQADLLPSCYDEWIGPERERLRQRYLQALDQLIRLLEAEQEYSAAIDYARRMVRHDALNEESYRRLMRLLARTGDRAGALRVYHACAGALERELGIAPGSGTTELYEQLLRMDDMIAPVGERRQILSTSPTLIGRQREWERLLAAWLRASAGEPGMVLVTGEAGIGKSRLAEEMLLWASQHGALIAKTRCYAAEGRLSLSPVTEWLRADTLRPHLARLDPVWLTEVSRLLPELSSEYPHLPRYEPISEYGQRHRFFEALARAVLGAPQPLLLMIDDLQWCDQETLDWLHFLLRFDTNARLLVIGGARTEGMSPEHPLRTLLLELYHRNSMTEIPLQPLDAAETASLAASLSYHELSTGMVMRLYHETEGNPLFVVETIRAGFDGARSRDGTTDDGADKALSQDSPVLPPRVRAVITARLAQLAPAARELAVLAAAIGREFRLDVLANAGAGEHDDSLRALDELWQRRIIREQGANTYDFTHDKLREVAYAETSVPQRRLLHRRIAQALEVVYGGEIDSVCVQIASHFESAGLPERAIPYYQRAATVAQRVYANEDAIEYLVRALGLLALLPGGAARDSQELRLLLALEPIYRITRGWTAPELEQVVNRALELCTTVGDDAQRAEALYGQESLLVVQAQLEKVLELATRLQALNQRSRPVAHLLPDMMAAGARFHLGEIAAADREFERVFRADDPMTSPDFQYSTGWNYAILARAWHAHVLWCLGYPERALHRGSEAVQLARGLALPFNEALASTYLALLQQIGSDVATAKAHAESAYALAIEYRAPYYRAWAAILVAYADAHEQPDTQRLTQLADAIADFKTSGARLRLPYYLWLLASAYALAGRPDAGLKAIDEGLAAAQTYNERWWDAELYRMQGELLQVHGGHDRQIEAALLQAAEIAHSQQARSLELRAAMSLARWFCNRGNRDAARRRLSEVYGWFSEGFETPDLHTARALLVELA